jgi:exoribonuclease R
MQYVVHETDKKNKMQLKLFVEDGQYKEYKYLDTKTMKPMENQPNIHPVYNKLFNQDIIEVDNDTKTHLTMKILHSSVRSMKNIPGVLVLDNNKTYGKIKNRFYYKCIPDDRRLPIFIIPYQEKLIFEKKRNNLYIVFEFHSWGGKHPSGRVMNNLGPINTLNSFYEYQLYCKSLYASMQKFNKETKSRLKLFTEEQHIKHMDTCFDFEDRTKYYIYTIDPETSKDFDDAFGIRVVDGMLVLSIYISNVSFWFRLLSLWESFSERISTIYLPDRKRPMLPTVLSDAICSLVEDHERFALTLDLVIDPDDNYNIVSSRFLNSKIRVWRNYRYETKELENENVLMAYKTVKELNKRHKYVDNITTTHDMIAYMMILMNYYSATVLKEHETGIYRSAKLNQTYKPPESVPDEVSKFLKIWHSFGGKYTKYENMESHDMLDFDAYVHITSPIRRLPDLLNILKLQDVLGLVKLQEQALEFYNKWTSEKSIEYINRTMRAIRRVQNECSLLSMCQKDESITKKIYIGYIFDKIIRNDALYQYMVHLPEIKMTNRITSRHNMDLNSSYEFKIYVFRDEARLKHKIRLEILNAH